MTKKKWKSHIFVTSSNGAYQNCF